MQKKELLPPLTKEQVENLVKFIKLNYDFDENYEYCCVSDAIDDACNAAIRVIRKGYGYEDE